jgi:hypothetical protein
MGKGAEFYASDTAPTSTEATEVQAVGEKKTCFPVGTLVRIGRTLVAAMTTSAVAAKVCARLVQRRASTPRAMRSRGAVGGARPNVGPLGYICRTHSNEQHKVTS